MTRPLRVAIIGSGPAGIYASDCLMKSAAAQDPGVSIDILERMPAPFGLIPVSYTHLTLPTKA